MQVIGLTGGIGSGKTTVANLFADRGIPVIDADIIARDVTKDNTPAYFSIVDRFGKTLLGEDSDIDRSKLRDIIFRDAGARQWLEALLHPLIIAQIESQLKKITAPYCIVAIPLLLETGPYAFIDRILVVDSPEALQIERVAKRDNTSTEAVKSILATQLARTERLAQAHDTITNDGDLDHLAQQIDQLHAAYTLG